MMQQVATHSKAFGEQNADNFTKPLERARRCVGSTSFYEAIIRMSVRWVFNCDCHVSVYVEPVHIPYFVFYSK